MNQIKHLRVHQEMEIKHYENFNCNWIMSTGETHIVCIALNLILFLLTVMSDGLVIMPTGDTHRVAEGTDIVFTCQVTEYQDAKLKWFDQDMEQITETNGRWVD